MYFAIARYAILPMCQEDLDELHRNGDMDAISKMIDEHERKNVTAGKNIDGRGFFKETENGN